MTESGFVIPNNILKIVNERVDIWEKFDHARKQFEDMQKLNAQVLDGPVAPLPSALTEEKTPPSEIASALVKLREEMNLISDKQATIDAYQDEISRIEQQRTTLLIIAGAVIGQYTENCVNSNRKTWYPFQATKPREENHVSKKKSYIEQGRTSSIHS